MLNQADAPVHAALETLKRARIVPFDVPGHKRGRGSRELRDFLGESCLTVDVNSMKPLDNLCHPTGVIRDAAALAAEAFGAAEAFFMVGGTTSSVQAMILASVGEGDKIILPRNVHRSVINALVLCGAEPVYVNPGVSPRLGIALGMDYRDVEKAADANPDAKAILVNNPTYYGVCPDLRRVTALARSRGMAALVDEAHGAHFYFGGGFPVSAMAAGADMASVSMHKSGGSLTQSSLLLAGPNVDADYLRQIINLTQTTSGSYLLLVSLDLSRRNLVMSGRDMFGRVLEMAEYARGEINQIGGYYAFGRETADGGAAFDFDRSKLSVNTLDVGLAGIEVYDILRDEYDIQIEFGDLGNILAYVSAGDNYKNIERLIGALGEIRRFRMRGRAGMLAREYVPPVVDLLPKAAFFAPKESVPLASALGRVGAEFAMCYPPGIPILAPGERVTADVIDYIRYAKDRGCYMTGTADMSLSNLNVVK
ncbi:MAG: aminotransferase class I/II-fold pyridoxal phosphate-dependent enzyme [Clostridiales bacterium]|jgi:arginine/lysine/ornithine decarboxylase|nr:aminotransferase class I/II-fold pyridoxal phosphate-dependent enzyme [Clostridiales bacterium]